MRQLGWAPAPTTAGPATAADRHEPSVTAAATRAFTACAAPCAAQLSPHFAAPLLPGKLKPQVGCVALCAAASRSLAPESLEFSHIHLAARAIQ